MSNGKYLVPWTKALTFVAFSILLIQTPILIYLRLAGSLFIISCPDWLIAILVVRIVFNIYALKTKLFFDQNKNIFFVSNILFFTYVKSIS